MKKSVLKPYLFINWLCDNACLMITWSTELYFIFLLSTIMLRNELMMFWGRSRFKSTIMVRKYRMSVDVDHEFKVTCGSDGWGVRCWCCLACAVEVES